MTTYNKMPSRAFLYSLKSKTLKNWAFLTGLPTTGHRAELADSIFRSMDNEPSHDKPARTIVSVDMGIRNLAFCVVEGPVARKQPLAQSTQINVKSWVRMDLLKTRCGPKTDAHENDGSHPVSTEPVVVRKKSARCEDVSPIEKGAFEPDMLSRTAYRVTREVLKYNPDIILIERQRFRSGGAAPIQEWTVRVNMLESMIWACLETLRAQSEHSSLNFPEVVPMSPSRVAKFWIAGQSSSLSVPGDFFATKPRTSRLLDESLLSKIVPNGEAVEKVSKPRSNTKEEKVAAVRSWILGESDIRLDFEDECAHVARAFRLQQKKIASELAGGKLDDLADCLLQAVTWVRWQQNRHRIEELCEEFNRTTSA